jgi:threonine/homoserine/homoserine lactone efflux protein
MNLFDFIATVIVVTASGALAPGPLSFAILMQGAKGGARSGFTSAIGHMLVEFPLVLALALGLLVAVNQPMIKSIIGLVGGLGLIVFGILQIYGSLKHNPKSDSNSTIQRLPASSLALGLALTGFNPYFILWWLTVGSVLIVQALAFAAIIGVLIMYVSHVWMDYAFLTALAYFSKKGNTIVGSRYYKGLLIAFGLILVYYGASFAIGAFRA